MLEKGIIVAMIIMSIHVSFSWHGMIFYFVSGWAEDIGMPKWLRKITYDCPICQVPYMGSVIYWAFLGNDWKEWIVVIFTAMGINSVIVWAMRPK